MKTITLEFVELSVNRLVSSDESHFNLFDFDKDNDYLVLIDYDKKLKKIIKQGGQLTEFLNVKLVSDSSVITWEFPALFVIMLNSHRNVIDIMDRIVIDTLSVEGKFSSFQSEEVDDLFPNKSDWVYGEMKNYSYYWYENCMLKGRSAFSFYLTLILYPREITL